MGTELSLIQIDAFTSELFGGNPAAVCPLETWLPDETLQNIAAENNLAETAFFIGGQGRYQLRWFTPKVEMPLCGHATLATAFHIFTDLEPEASLLTFETLSADLSVKRNGDALTMDFPAQAIEPANQSEMDLSAMGGNPPAAVWRVLADWGAETNLLLFQDEQEVRDLAPQFSALKSNVIATAPAASPDVHFISRFFAPMIGIDEDPVTGGAHCVLAPFWAERLAADRMEARQLSERGGELSMRVEGARVYLTGRCVPYLKGTITLPGRL